jgi:nitrite reductase/ring-hydroxylating ferredoxin subunit
MTTADTFDVCSIEDLQRKKSMVFNFHHPVFGLHEIAVFWDGEKVYALENSCPHMFGSLAYGPIEKNQVTCPLHGAVFELSTGKCIDLFTDDVQPYQVEIHNGRVFVVAPGESRTGGR